MRQQKRPKNTILEPAMYLGNVLPMLLPFLFIQFLKLLTSIYSMNKFSPQRSSNRREGISLDFWSLSKGKLFFRSFSKTEEKFSHHTSSSGNFMISVIRFGSNMRISTRSTPVCWLSENRKSFMVNYCLFPKVLKSTYNCLQSYIS